MRKSTKLITTAIALVLVISAMVVGIYAATAASAGITASVSWTATDGVAFKIYGWTEGSKEDMDSRSGSEKTFDDEAANSDEPMFKGVGNYVKNHRMTEISVDRTTTNSAASGISRNFNASFYDGTNDGVNNPQSIYYIYYFESHYELLSEPGEDVVSAELQFSVTKFPTSTSNVKVEWKYVNSELLNGPYYNFVESGHLDEMNTTPPSGTMSFGNFGMDFFCIKLTLLTPDQNLTNFDASVGFRISINYIVLE